MLVICWYNICSGFLKCQKLMFSQILLFFSCQLFLPVSKWPGYLPPKVFSALIELVSNGRAWIMQSIWQTHLFAGRNMFFFHSDGILHSCRTTASSSSSCPWSHLLPAYGVQEYTDQEYIISLTDGASACSRNRDHEYVVNSWCAQYGTESS